MPVEVTLVIFSPKSIAMPPEVIKRQIQQNVIFLWKYDVVSETSIGRKSQKIDGSWDALLLWCHQK